MLVNLSDHLERLILDGADESEISKAARNGGFITMQEDAIIKALNHIIPFEEVGTLGGAMLISDEAEKEKEETEVPVDNPEDVGV